MSVQTSAQIDPLSRRWSWSKKAPLRPRARPLPTEEGIRLVERVQAGAATGAEAAALGWWIVERAYRHLVRRGQSPAEAEELALETFARTWKAIVAGQFRL